MSNLFRYGGPYEIAIDSYGSTLADLPIKFAHQFSRSFGTFDYLSGMIIGGLVLYYLIERFGKKTPRGLLKLIPFVGKYV